MTETNTGLHFLGRFPRPKFLPHGPILENQRRVLSEFFIPKAEFIKLNLLPKRPLLESIGCSLITYVGVVTALDGWINAGTAILHRQTYEYWAIVAAARVAQGLVGAIAVVGADSWKKSLRRRESQNSLINTHSN